jgi:hypothetical protein
MMQDTVQVRLNAYRNNIQRYRRLLRTRLTELERQYILKRLQEEECEAALLQECPLPWSTQASHQLTAGIS